MHKNRAQVMPYGNRDARSAFCRIQFLHRKLRYVDHSLLRQVSWDCFRIIQGQTRTPAALQCSSATARRIYAVAAPACRCYSGFSGMRQAIQTCVGSAQLLVHQVVRLGEVRQDTGGGVVLQQRVDGAKIRSWMGHMRIENAERGARAGRNLMIPIQLAGAGEYSIWQLADKLTVAAYFQCSMPRARHQGLETGLDK